jgi:hypothetical protein
MMYEDNGACTAMGNAQRPTSRTSHMDIKYFLLCDWVECDLIQLERIDTTVNMADLFAKSLQRATFHRHVDFVLGHIPPKYSPVHTHLVGTYSDDIIPGDQYVPPSFTTPITAAAARVCAPVNEDYLGNCCRPIILRTVQEYLPDKVRRDTCDKARPLSQV